MMFAQRFYFQRKEKWKERNTAGEHTSKGSVFNYLVDETKDIRGLVPAEGFSRRDETKGIEYEDRSSQ